VARTSSLAKSQLDALGRLKRAGALDGLVLVGGGAIGFHLGHRRSRDLDLFTAGKKPSLAVLKRRIAGIRGARIVGESDATLAVDLSGVAIDFVQYPYALLDAPLDGPRGTSVATLRDLAPMKLSALARRGLRRDFWDLYAIIRAGRPLQQIASDYRAKFGLAEADLYHVARALTYFDDAEREEALPEGMTPTLWRSIKRFFTTAAPALLRPDPAVPRPRRKAP